MCVCYMLVFTHLVRFIGIKVLLIRQLVRNGLSCSINVVSVVSLVFQEEL